jgi:DNA-binding CsgD family transcriptional regulator
MKKQLTKALGLLCYLTIVGLLFDFNWILLFKLKPFLSVILGMFILTASQYKKQYTKEDLAVSLKWNLLFASFLTTLVSILSSASSMGMADMTGWQLTESLLPMFYGSIIYLILNIVLNDSIERKGYQRTEGSRDLTASLIAEQVFREFELTGRECHVALKLLENIPNKEVAAQLYISEATVKKHIQNIYQKFGATDRNSFRKVYLQSAERK